MADNPYDLAYTLAGTRRTNPYDARRRFGMQMLQSGSDYSPVAHPLQGAARLAQALVGGWIGNKADRDEKQASDDRYAKLAEALAEPDPNKRITKISAIDPEQGLRLGGQLAIEQAKLGQQRAGLNATADTYGRPGGQVTQAPLPAPGGTGNAGQAIAGIESAGGPNNGYGAVGPVANQKGNRAYGKYQVMDFNIGPWTQEVLGQAMTPEQFLANPQAQDAVFQAKFNQYVQKHGSPEAASRAWFAGEGGMNNPGASDVNGMTVDRYGQKFAQAYGPGAGGQAPPAAPPVTILATPPGQPSQGQPQPLQINMPGPQGAAETNGMPPTPSPQGVQGPTMSAPPVPPQRLSIEDAPREMLAPFIDRFRRGGYGTNPAEAEIRMRADMQAALDRSYENQKLEYDRLRSDFDYNRKRGADQTEHDRRKALDAAEHDRRENSKPMNDTQSLAGTYADRMAEAEAVLSGIPTSVLTSGQGNTVGSIPLIGDWAANQVRSSDYQKYQQAKNNFINAQLRKESGAAIGKDEYTAADRQYFPQPGDSDEVIQQKAVNRRIAIDGMVRSAGPSYRPTQARTAPADLKKKYGLE